MQVAELSSFDFYRIPPPRSNFKILVETFSRILDVLIGYKHTIIINGDFNIHFEKVATGDTACFLDLLASYGLRRTIFRPTRATACLDNIFVNIHPTEFTAEVLDDRLSDHHPIGISFRSTHASVRKTVSFVPITNAGLYNFYNYVTNVSWHFVTDVTLDPSLKCVRFVDLLCLGMQNSFPTVVKNVTKKDSKIRWFTPELRRMRDTLSIVNFISKQVNNPELATIARRFRAVYRSTIASARHRAHDDFISHSSNQAKAMWSIVNEFRTVGRKRASTDITADQFNDYFSNIADTIVNSLPSSTNLGHGHFMENLVLPEVVPMFHFKELSYVEVRDEIFNLTNSNSRDIYGFNSRVLKCIGNLIYIPLTNLFNHCLRMSVFPDCLKVARVVPVHKKGSASEPNNFRPISVVPLIGKIFERLLHARIVVFLETHMILNKAQFGFRKGLSASMAISRLVQLISDAFDSGSFVGTLFCDLSRAFDCVSSDILVSKLKRYKFSDSSISLVESYLSNRQQQVHLEDAKSNFSVTSRGVPQGSVLGPILFLLYINDLVYSMPDTEFILFADDTTVVSIDQHISLLSGVMEDVRSRVEAWFTSNQLKLNPDKTNTVCFSLRPHTGEGSLSARFLGIFVDSRLTWDVHTDYLAGKIASNVYALRNLAHFVSKKVLLSAYHALVHSHLEYALIAWGNASGAGRVFAIQRRAVRVVAGLGYRDDCRSAFARLGVLTLPSAYILQCLLHVRQHRASYTTHSEVHHHQTRNRDNIYVDYHRVEKSRFGPNYDGPRFFNKLPGEIRELPLNSFKRTVKRFLLDGSYYSLDEFLLDRTDFPPVGGS